MLVDKLIANKAIRNYDLICQQQVSEANPHQMFDFLFEGIISDLNNILWAIDKIMDEMNNKQEYLKGQLKNVLFTSEI